MTIKFLTFDILVHSHENNYINWQWPFPDMPIYQAIVKIIIILNSI